MGPEWWLTVPLVKYRIFINIKHNPRDITNNEDGDDDEEDNRVGFFLDVCLPLLYRGVDADIEKCEKYKRDQAEEDQPCQVLVVEDVVFTEPQVRDINVTQRAVGIIKNL